MNNKQKIDMIIALCLILVSVILLILPMFHITNINHLMIFVFSSYSIFNLIQFIFTYKSKDYESLFTAFISILTLILSIIFEMSSPRTLALILMCWIALMSLTKLKKIDYYHDRHDEMWKVRVFNLLFFILAGILTSINLAYSSEVQIIIIGFFMLIHGILELFDPLVKTLITH